MDRDHAPAALREAKEGARETVLAKKARVRQQRILHYTLRLIYGPAVSTDTLNMLIEDLALAAAGDNLARRMWERHFHEALHREAPAPPSFATEAPEEQFAGEIAPNASRWRVFEGLYS